MPTSSHEGWQLVQTTFSRYSSKILLRRRLLQTERWGDRGRRHWCRHRCDATHRVVLLLRSVRLLQVPTRPTHHRRRRGGAAAAAAGRICPTGARERHHVRVIKKNRVALRLFAPNFGIKLSQQKIKNLYNLCLSTHVTPSPRKSLYRVVQRCRGQISAAQKSTSCRGGAV